MRRPIALLVIALALGPPGSVWAYHHLSWLTPDGQAIRHQVVAATYAYHAFDNPPAGYSRGHVPREVLRKEVVEADVLAHRLYTGVELAAWLRTYPGVIARQASHSPYDVGWTTTSVQPGTLSLLPLSAEATVRGTYVSTLGQVSVWDDRYHLIRTSQGWRIDRELDGRCVSGCP